MISSILQFSQSRLLKRRFLHFSLLSLEKTISPLPRGGDGDAGNEMIFPKEDLKNLSKTEQPTGGGDGGYDACATKHFKSKIRQLQNEQKSPSSNLKLVCPEVPPTLRFVKDAKVYYTPQVMSFGPYHHGNPELQAGEALKLNLAATYLRAHAQFVYGMDRCVDEDIDRSVDDIYSTIRGDIDELMKCYNPKSTEKYTKEELSQMLLVDGCALLRYILCVCFGDHEEYGIRYQDLSRIHQDALLLENQLPYQILLELMKKIQPSERVNAAWRVILLEFFGMTEESTSSELLQEESFLRKMKNYCCSPIIQFINWNPEPNNTEKESKPCNHLLDLYRRNSLGDEERSINSTHSKTTTNPESVRDVKDQVMASFRNVKELMAAGIRIKRSPTRHLRDISFTSNGITACLILPPITIDSSTKTLFLNLIAYEMSSDVPHDFISYLRFLDSLIDHADDVKELQYAGVLQNYLGTHEQVAEFFNTISSNLESNFHAYKDVRVKIRKHLKSHYNSRLKMWITQCLHTYFSSPWTIIAWVGATLALFFSAIQTCYCLDWCYFCKIPKYILTIFRTCLGYIKSYMEFFGNKMRDPEL